jgi:UDP-N-acetyl-D-mannosaminuronate dehydrogenase
VRIGVVGLGKIGLPLAVQYAGKGHELVGVDVDARTVDLVNAGRAPFPGEADLDDRLASLVRGGALRAVVDYAEAIPLAEVVVMVVPLFVDDETWQPDFGWIDSATTSIGTHLRPGTLVCYETRCR